jgi:hypothetical protein
MLITAISPARPWRAETAFSQGSFGIASRRVPSLAAALLNLRFEHPARAYQ